MREELRAVVVLSLFGRDSRELGQRRIPLYDWYESLHPIIDSADERLTLGVVKIMGEQYDLQGKLMVRFTNLYDDSGNLIDSQSYEEGEEN